MEWRKIASPVYTLLEIDLNPGETVVAQPGAFVTSIGEFDVKTNLFAGGFFKAMKRALFSRESTILNYFTARTKVKLTFAPSLPGDVEGIPLNGNGIYIGDGKYLAHYGNIDLDIKSLGLSGIFTKGGIFWLHAKGNGIVWLESYGALVPVDVPDGQYIVVDNNHLAAMTDNARWDLIKFKGLKSFLFGGEGFVIKIYGPAKVWIQTRSLDQLAMALQRYLPSH